MLETGELVKRYADGVPMRALSAACGQSRVQVWRRLRAVGVEMRGRRREECPACGGTGRVKGGRVEREVEAGKTAQQVRVEQGPKVPVVRCPTHRMYHGQYAPALGCEGCWGIWREVLAGKGGG
jgi:hypothetical protein